MIQGSTVSKATGYQLNDRAVGVRVPIDQELSLLHNFQTGSEAHVASYAMGTGDSFSDGKEPCREAHYSPQTSADIKKKWIYVSTSPHVFMAQCLIS
jgi:hypothetical protein